MADNFHIVLPWVEAYEGGYVNHPRDPGGATNRGVTQRTYDSYRRSEGERTRDVRQLTESEHDEIYRRQYWALMKCDALPSGVDAMVMDFGVNSGPARSVKYLQRIVGADVDGVAGFQTIAATQAYCAKHGASMLIIQLGQSRMAFLRRLKTFKDFGKGWTRRVMGQHDGVQLDDIGIIDRATKLALAKSPAAAARIAKPTGPANGKAVDTSMRFWPRLVEALGDAFRRIRGAGA